MNMRDVDVAKVAEYAAEDADVTWQVAEAIRPDIETRGVSKVCYEVECPLIPVLVDMEYRRRPTGHRCIGDLFGQVNRRN